MTKSFKILLTVIILLISQFHAKGVTLYIFEEGQQIANRESFDSTQTKRELNSYYSNEKLGAFVENGQTTFRLFAPSGVRIALITFKNPKDEIGNLHEMRKDDNGVWEVVLPGEKYGTYYGYKIIHSNDQNISDSPLCIDPYAQAVTSFTDYMNPRKSIVYKDDYDWEDDTCIERDWRDLIIYEMHIRDMTAHPSSGAKNPGSYKGLIEDNIKGGINYIKDLGVNTVELLPAQEFGNIEIPFKDSISGKFNTWNPYEQNHWGYMTSAFFAPSSYYSENWKSLKWNEWMGSEGHQVNEFKDMVKAFHKEGIAVMMDVVYNHLSEYEIGNLKEIDRDYYFRLDNNSNYIRESGCGNDIKTERPMMRRLIVDSILYWMKEYHIDGFRFDLGRLIDWETIEEIIREAKKVNPNVVFVCEPWGGGYDPKGFSLREWGSWNDQIRNGIKGENPTNGLGWIFGNWYGNNNINRIKSYVNGTLIKFKHGLFQKQEHSVNYLESHDGYTLGDFIRIGSGELDPKNKISDVDANVKLTPYQTKLNKLAALFLFTSQGITMIHSGQEFARSKVISLNNDIPDKHKGLIDHNSYDKDNETNYINFSHAKINKDLFDYYKGLIELRKTYDAFRHADIEDITFFEIKNNEFTLGYQINYNEQRYIVLLNADQEKSEEFKIPEGEWEIIVDKDNAGITPLNVISNNYQLPPISGAVLKKQ